MADIRLKTIALGYTAAYTRLTEAYSKAYANPNDVAEETTEEVFRATFEALNWLDALRCHPEGEREIDPTMNDAIRFVRGRVHHQFGDAIELRNDVLMPVGMTGLGSVLIQPIAIVDWCWRQAADLPGGGRTSSAASQKSSGEAAYKSVLEGRQARQALDYGASIASQLIVRVLSSSVSQGTSAAGHQPGMT